MSSVLVAPTRAQLSTFITNANGNTDQDAVRAFELLFAQVSTLALQNVDLEARITDLENEVVSLDARITALENP